MWQRRGIRWAAVVGFALALLLPAPTLAFSPPLDLWTPPVGGPYPGIVIGYGHHGRGSAELALVVAPLGYVAFAIDGPSAGESTGGQFTHVLNGVDERVKGAVAIAVAGNGRTLTTYEGG